MKDFWETLIILFNSFCNGFSKFLLQKKCDGQKYQMSVKLLCLNRFIMCNIQQIIEVSNLFVRRVGVFEKY